MFSNFPIESGKMTPFLVTFLLKEEEERGNIPLADLIEAMDALVAQLDRVSDYESEGRGFESCLARHDVKIAEIIGIFCYL